MADGLRERGLDVKEATNSASDALRQLAAGMFDIAVDRDPAVLVAQHVFGINFLDQTLAHEGEQHTSAQGGLHPGHSGLIDSTGRVPHRSFAQYLLLPDQKK